MPVIPHILYAPSLERLRHLRIICEYIFRIHSKNEIMSVKLIVLWVINDELMVPRRQIFAIHKVLISRLSICKIFWRIDDVDIVVVVVE